MARLSFVKIPPHQLRYKIMTALDLKPGKQGGDWDITRRVRLDETDKFKSVVAHFTKGVPWEQTPLFTDIYTRRLGLGGEVRGGCKNLKELVKFYYSHYDSMFEHMKQHGFVTFNDDMTQVSIPHVFVCRDGELALGNNGNHRVPMAQILDLPFIVVELRTVHPDAPEQEWEYMKIETDLELPDLHDGALEVPAMTSLHERLAYYNCAKEQAPKGTIVEIGTWLGASTIFIAAGVRDAGGGKVHAYDRFQWNKKSHDFKAGGPLEGEMYAKFISNLGPLAQYVEAHPGELMRAKWDGTPISYLACDGPKRVREICQTFDIFGSSLIPGALTSWQDFAYFPSYDVVACIDRLEQQGVLAFVDAVYPGTTVIMRVLRPPRGHEIKQEALALSEWTSEAIETTWRKWADRLPEEARPRFMVGAAFFLLDKTDKKRAMRVFNECLEQDKTEAIANKFAYFRAHREAYVTKYAPLFKMLP